MTHIEMRSVYAAQIILTIYIFLNLESRGKKPRVEAST